MIVWSPHLIIWILLALAHLLLPPGLLRYYANKGKSGSERAHRITVIYSGVMAAWALSGALTALTEPTLVVGAVAGGQYRGSLRPFRTSGDRPRREGRRRWT